MTNKELLEDLLIEFDELGMEPTTIVPNPSERAIRWKRELMSAIEHWGAEVAREIFGEIERFLKSQEAISENKRLKEVGDWIFHDYLPTQLAALEKKYTGDAP